MNIDVREFELKTPDSGPYGIDVSDDGKVWFTQHKANKISYLDTNGKIKEFEIPTPDARVQCLRFLRMDTSGSLKMVQIRSER